MSIQKLSNLEAYVKEFLTHDIYKKDVRALRRIRARIQRALDQNCCGGDGGSVTLGITGPTGTIASGASPYPFVIESSVTGVPDSEVETITLYINDVLIETQNGNDFSYASSRTAQVPSQETVYYTVAVLKDGRTIVSPIMQFLLTQTSPTWSFLIQSQIAQTSQTRHIIDRVSDVDLDTITVSFINLPSFCTASLIPVSGVPGQSSVVVDITCSPGAGNAGTYSFTMRANDGVVNVDKVVSLVVDANTHLRINPRNTAVVNVPQSTPMFTVIDNFTLSSQGNGLQNDTVPQPNFLSLGMGTGPGATQIYTAGAVAANSVGKKQIVLAQFRNATTGTGNRYEDAIYNIITIT